MTNEEAINILRILKNCYNDKSEDSFIGFDDKDNEALNIAIKSLEQQPSEDCISREVLDDAISELTYWHPTTDGRLEVGGGFDKTVYKVEDVWRLIKVLPSVTPQPKIGHWEYVQYDSDPNIGNWHCSECRGICTEMHSIEDAYNYCPNCGAKMEGKE